MYSIKVSMLSWSRVRPGFEILGSPSDRVVRTWEKTRLEDRGHKVETWQLIRSKPADFTSCDGRSMLIGHCTHPLVAEDACTTLRVHRPLTRSNRRLPVP